MHALTVRSTCRRMTLALSLTTLPRARTVSRVLNSPMQAKSSGAKYVSRSNPQRASSTNDRLTVTAFLNRRATLSSSNSSRRLSWTDSMISVLKSCQWSSANRTAKVGSFCTLGSSDRLQHIFGYFYKVIIFVNIGI